MKVRLFVAALLMSGTLALGFMPVGNVLAATEANCSESGGGFLGFPTWYKYLDFEFINGQCEFNTFAFPDDLPKVGIAILEILLRIGGLVAIAFVVYGGFKYVTSQGEPDSTRQARQSIQNAMIGLVIAIIATAAVSYIGRAISQ